MKSIKCDLPVDLKELKIELFFDLHIGSRKCKYDEIQKRIQNVLENDDVYCIIGGDILNNSIIGSVASADLYESEVSPMEQVQTAIRIFEPIKHKILGVCSGNHEQRSYKSAGIDLIQLFCAELGILDRYDYASCLLFIRFGKNENRGYHCRRICYTLYFAHGNGQGGKLVGSKANGLAKRGEIIPNCDVVVTGHTHSPLSFKDAYMDIDYANSCVIPKERLFVNASATLEYEQYAELIGCKPSSISSPVVILDGRNKCMRAVM